MVVRFGPNRATIQPVDTPPLPSTDWDRLLFEHAKQVVKSLGQSRVGEYAVTQNGIR